MARALFLFAVCWAVACGSSESDDVPSPGAVAGGGAGGDEAAGGDPGASGAPTAAGAGGMTESAGAGGAAGASEAAGAGGGGAAALPTMLHLEGEAATEPNADGEHVECSFYGDFVDLVFDEAGSFSGVFVGEAFRSGFVDGDKVSEFAPLLGGDGSLTQLEGGSVELRFVGDQPDDAAEFWLELEVVEGEHEGDYHYSGTFTCAPVLLDDPGYPELDIDAEGSWTLEPP